MNSSYIGTLLNIPIDKGWTLKNGTEEVTKYKVNEVAKDLNLNNKEIIEVLGEFYEEPKKAQTALDTRELDVLFDVLTQKNSVESFNSYFAMKKVEEKKEEKVKKDPLKIIIFY